MSRSRPGVPPVVGSTAVAIAILATLVAGAAPAAATPPSRSLAPAAPGAAFVVGTTEDVDSLNPFTGVGRTAHEASFLIYDTLTGWSPRDLSPAPTGLARSWERSADGRTWTYHLHAGVTWSDGQPLTARDVAYTFNRIMTGERERPPFAEYVSTITTVTAADDATVVMRTSAPSPIMEQLWVPILPEHVWRGVDGAGLAGFRNDHPVGSGPFSLVEHRPAELLRFRANPGYFGGAPAVGEVRLRIFAGADPMVRALRSGEIDLARDVPAAAFDGLDGEPGIATLASKSRDGNGIAINVGAATAGAGPVGDGHPALRDRRVRQAIARAVDRAAIVDTVLGGYGERAATVIPSMYGALHWDPGGAATPFDLAGANRILDEAGYARDPDGVRAMPGGGRSLDLRLSGRRGERGSEQTVRLVAGWLSRIGIRPVVTMAPEDQLAAWIRAGRYDLVEWGWSVEPDPDEQLSAFTCPRRSTRDGWSGGLYCNPAYDELYRRQRTTVDRTARAALVRRMQQILYQDAACVVTHFRQTLEAFRSDRVTNLQRQPTDGGPLVYQFGAYTYRMVTPVSGTPGAARGGQNNAVTIGVGLAAVLVLILVFRAVFFRRPPPRVRA